MNKTVIKKSAVALLACCVALIGTIHDSRADAPPRKPAVLFTGVIWTTPNDDFARWLDRDGFAVQGMSFPGIAEKPLTWEEARHFNVIVIVGVGSANADGTLSASNRQTIETLNRFLAEGGGILYFPQWFEENSQIPSQEAFIKPLGLTPLFDQVAFDPANAVTATPWKIDMAHTTSITPSPITEGVTSLWYPSSTRAGDMSHIVPFLTDSSWHVVATGSPTSSTRTVGLEADGIGKAGDPGKFKASVPLAAYREVGKGRIVVCGINAAWMHGTYSRTSLGGTVTDRGVNGVPSHGYQLVLDSLRWLAQPSLANAAQASSVETVLGGAEGDPALRENPYLTKFCPAIDWTNTDHQSFPSVARTCLGVVGARTTLSGGKATPEAWVKAAKANGLSYIVFLEDFAGLSEANFAKLKSECARLTDSNFAAIPGIRIQDVIGNHYFYCGMNTPYPIKKLLSDDGKVFVSNDPAVNSAHPRDAKGQINSTLIQYVYGLGGCKFESGNYLGRSETSPFANFFALNTLKGVITRENGKVIQDDTPEYLQQIQDGEAPQPMVVDLMDDPAQLTQTPWRTVLRINKDSDQVNGGPLKGVNPLAAYFNLWHVYPDNPTRIYITGGPQIDYWSSLGSTDYTGNNRGNFVWQNYRWRVGGKVSSEVGLKEVAVYDGSKLFRRFLPENQKQFEFALDLNHNKQHNLVLIATDANGSRAISGEQWDRNHRLEECICGDRDNQLGYGYQTRKDGTGLQLYCAPAVTFNQRIPDNWLDAAGTFLQDPLLGAPVFDGSVSGQPLARYPVNLLSKTGAQIPAPAVGEAQRLLFSGDTSIGSSQCDYNFTDGVVANNVWHAMWRVAPTPDFTLERRNQLFQIDPDSPLSVFLIKLRITMKRDIPNNGFLIAALDKYDSTRWMVRGSDGQILQGTMPATTPAKEEKLPFAPGACAAMLDSQVGGVAMFSLTDGLEASWPSPAPQTININLSASASPQKQGESREVEFLLVGIPRLMSETESVAKDSVATLQRFNTDFGVSTGKPRYALDLQSGKMTSQRYILRIDGQADEAFSGTLKGDLISTLPIAVSNLNDNWSAYLYDRTEKKARPLGVFENQAWATVRLHGQDDLFVGHPVTCDNRNIVLQLTQTGDNGWRLEVHNPTDSDLKVMLLANLFFDPLKDKKLPSESVEIKAGTSRYFDL